MYGRPYTVTFKAVSVSVQQDFFLLKPAADKPIALWGFEIDNVGIAADAGDAQEELYDIAINYIPATVTNGSGGTTPTPNTVLPNDTAASFTAHANDTTKATSSGTILAKVPVGVNVRIPGPDWWAPSLPVPTPIICANAAALAITLGSTPTDAILLSGCCWVTELV